MCIYIYYPEKKITLRYISESIETHKRKYSLIVDAFIENNSEGDIDNLLLVFPHTLFKVAGKPGNSRLECTGIFEDISNEIFDPECPRNKLFDFESIDRHIEKNRDGSRSIKITQPSPSDPEFDYVLEADVVGTNAMFPIKLSDECWKILSDINMSILQCRLGVPIPSGGKRFFRWRLKPDNEVRREDGYIIRALNWMRDRTIFSFGILSPHKVVEKFIKEVSTFYMIVKRGSAHKLIPYVNQIIDEIVNRGIHNSTSLYLDLRINLFRSRFSHIYIGSTRGDVAPVGSMPNKLRISKPGILKRGFDHIFQWKSGPVNGCGAENSIKFTIFYETRVSNVIIPIVSWVAFILAIYSVFR